MIERLYNKNNNNNNNSNIHSNNNDNLSRVHQLINFCAILIARIMVSNCPGASLGATSCQHFVFIIKIKYH